MSSTLLALGIVAAVILLAWFNGRREAAAKAARRTLDIEGNGSFNVEVVGESHYQAALRKCVFGTGYVREEFSARLVCEDENKHDRKAVRVEIQGRTVGYLPRESAVAYRQLLARNHFGNATGLLRAVVVGGGPDRPSYGVWLDISGMEE